MHRWVFSQSSSTPRHSGGAVVGGGVARVSGESSAGQRRASGWSSCRSSCRTSRQGPEYRAEPTRGAVSPRCRHLARPPVSARAVDVGAVVVEIRWLPGVPSAPPPAPQSASGEAGDPAVTLLPSGRPTGRGLSEEVAPTAVCEPVGLSPLSVSPWSRDRGRLEGTL